MVSYKAIATVLAGVLLAPANLYALEGKLPGLDKSRIPNNSLPGFSSPSNSKNLHGFHSPLEETLPDFMPTKNSIQCAGIAGYVKERGTSTASGSNLVYTLDFSKYGFELKFVLSNNNPHDKDSSLEIKLKSGSETLLTINDKRCNGRIEGGTKESQIRYSKILDVLFSLMYEPKKPKKMA